MSADTMIIGTIDILTTSERPERGTVWVDVCVGLAFSDAPETPFQRRDQFEITPRAQPAQTQRLITRRARNRALDYFNGGGGPDNIFVDDPEDTPAAPAPNWFAQNNQAELDEYDPRAA